MKLTFHVQTHHDALCPVCLEPLPEYATVFRHHMAFCSACAGPTSPLPLFDTAETVRHYVNRSHVHEHYGLCWYTPPAKPPKAPLILFHEDAAQWLRTPEQTPVGRRLPWFPPGQTGRMSARHNRRIT